jgi:hypothetical protein
MAFKIKIHPLHQKNLWLPFHNPIKEHLIFSKLLEQYSKIPQKLASQLLFQVKNILLNREILDNRHLFNSIKIAPKNRINMDLLCSTNKNRFEIHK